MRYRLLSRSCGRILTACGYFSVAVALFVGGVHALVTGYASTGVTWNNASHVIVTYILVALLGQVALLLTTFRKVDRKRHLADAEPESGIRDLITAEVRALIGYEDIYSRQKLSSLTRDERIEMVRGIRFNLTYEVEGDALLTRSRVISLITNHLISGTYLIAGGLTLLRCSPEKTQQSGFPEALIASEVLTWITNLTILLVTGAGLIAGISVRDLLLGRIPWYRTAGPHVTKLYALKAIAEPISMRHFREEAKCYAMIKGEHQHGLLETYISVTDYRNWALSPGLTRCYCQKMRPSAETITKWDDIDDDEQVCCSRSECLTLNMRQNKHAMQLAAS